MFPNMLYSLCSSTNHGHPHITSRAIPSVLSSPSCKESGNASLAAVLRAVMCTTQACGRLKRSASVNFNPVCCCPFKKGQRMSLHEPSTTGKWRLGQDGKTNFLCVCRRVVQLEMWSLLYCHYSKALNWLKRAQGIKPCTVKTTQRLLRTWCFKVCYGDMDGWLGY